MIVFFSSSSSLFSPQSGEPALPPSCILPKGDKRDTTSDLYFPLVGRLISMVMRLSTFDEDPVIEYTCCTACISRNHGLGPYTYTLHTSSFSERRKIEIEEEGESASISKRVVLSLAGL